jgi:hypothetical protein
MNLSQTAQSQKSAAGPTKSSRGRVPHPLRQQRAGPLLRETCVAPGRLSGRGARRTCGNSDGEMPCRRHVSETLPLLMPSCTICHFPSGVRSTRGLLPMAPPVLEALTLARCAAQFSRGALQVGTSSHLSGHRTNQDLGIASIPFHLKNLPVWLMMSRMIALSTPYPIGVLASRLAL